MKDHILTFRNAFCNIIQQYSWCLAIINFKTKNDSKENKKNSLFNLIGYQ